MRKSVSTRYARRNAAYRRRPVQIAWITPTARMIPVHLRATSKFPGTIPSSIASPVSHGTATRAAVHPSPARIPSQTHMRSGRTASRMSRQPGPSRCPFLVQNAPGSPADEATSAKMTPVSGFSVQSLRVPSPPCGVPTFLPPRPCARPDWCSRCSQPRRAQPVRQPCRPRRRLRSPSRRVRS